MKRIIFISLLFCLHTSVAQKSEIEWIGFEQLDDSLQIENKPVLVYFYTDWCVYCKKMDRNAFKNPDIISSINEKYYAVKMNAESMDSIEFEGQTFINEQAKTKRNGVHQIPLILASREDKKVSFPTLLVLDRNFRIRKRSFEYMTSERMKELIKG
ncbi:thioredoxin family protein [Christiangramia crocea]|uniref:Thioredoxin family protein n=1 Tax=Christiangramia crocea TaxID=2904124 RepID=A0A9X1UW90_9FLAO|nr:thioredoxin family protein [Gramella crocea]MCG9971331.1 thioredoxin family protein [Gramella crocea]